MQVVRKSVTDMGIISDAFKQSPFMAIVSIEVVSYLI
jgi:hypothetical protein